MSSPSNLKEKSLSKFSFAFCQITINGEFTIFMVFIPKILVLLFIGASHVKKSGHRQTLKNGSCGDRTHDLEVETTSLSPIVPWKRKIWTFPYINHRSYLLWPYIPKVVRPIPIGIELAPWWKKWKFFHFGKKFSTSKNFKKKKIIPKSHELEHSPEVEIFPLLVENFPLWQKIFLLIRIYKYP